MLQLIRQSWKSVEIVERLVCDELRMQARGGQSSPELGDTRKGLQGRRGHSSPELGDTCKGLRGRGGHRSPELGDTRKEFLLVIVRLFFLLSFCLPSCLRSCLPSCWSLCRLVSFLFPFVSLLVARCQPLPCNPFHLSPSSGLLCCNPRETRRETKGDRRETVTNKKGDKTGD